MKRPLAFVGFVYLLTQLLAAFLPPYACLLSAAFFMLCWLWLLHKKSKWAVHIFVLSLTIVTALVLRAGYQRIVISPLQRYHNTTHSISGTVQAVHGSYIDGKMNAEIQIRAVDGIKQNIPLKATAYLLPECTMGDEVCFTARTMSLDSNDEYLFYKYANGIFITLSDIESFTVQGKRHTLPYQMRYLQEKSSINIRRILPREYGTVACAMVVGDKSALSPQIKDNFKCAGIVHILVVSGLHLSVFSSLVYAIFRKIMNRKIASAFACVGVLWFMIFIGFTPSVMRAGIAMLLVYGGGICNRQSDALTSLGAAALLLCLLNPYAAVDVGLLLSFSSTLAVLFVSDRKVEYDAQHQEASFWSWATSRFLFFVAVPLATSFATLPVLMAVGSGVSLLSVLCNCIALPLLPIVLLFGFLIVICANISFLSPIFQLSGLLCGFCVKLLIRMSDWAAHIPGAFVHVAGIVPILCILLCGALFYYGVVCGIAKNKNKLYCGLLLTICIGIYIAFDANVVRIALVGRSETPSVVITQNLKTAVICRGASTQSQAIEDYLISRNRQEIDFWVDLRRNAKAEFPLSDFSAKAMVFAQRDLLHHRILRPFHDVVITVYHQEKGNAATIDIKGYTVCVADGTVDFANQQGIELYFAGKNAPQNLQCDTLILSRVNTWSEQISAEKYLTVRAPQLLVRGGKSVKLQGVTHDFE
ncbi:MAG: ComEC/Rec2 family competence protein [Ruthenibacterium sp.]